MSDQTREFIVPVMGMGCEGCASHVETALNSVDGVAEANVNLLSGWANVRYSEDRVRLEELVAAVRNVGYDIPVEIETLSIGGLRCAKCVTRVQDALAGVDGVVSASVNFVSEQATVTFVPDMTAPDDFWTAVSANGYQVL
jgi:Cu+-exporting ATPase